MLKMLQTHVVSVPLLCLFLLSGKCFTKNINDGDNVIKMSILDEFKEEPDHADTESLKNKDVTFSFAKHFSNNMVLQRAPARANIYGFSPNVGAKVILQLNTPSKPYYYTTKVEASATKGVGIWKVTLDPIEVNITANIKVLSEQGTLTLSNLIFGDVWICSGQSNMQFAVKQMFNASEELADAHNYPNIRVMMVSLEQSPTPLDDVIKINEEWSLPTNATIGRGIWQPMSAVCWLYGKNIHKATKVPIGLVESCWGGTPVEAWSSPDSLKACNVTEEEEPEVTGPFTNSVLYNAMIHPLLGMTIKGAIWYQGEADATKDFRMNRYNCTFPRMIADWRVKFNQASGQTSPNFPFGFVQLAPNSKDGNTISVGYPDIRWHQTADVGYVPNPKMPDTFMAVAIDLPDMTSPYGSVHPRDKLDVGERLALSGLAVAYHDHAMGPIFKGPFPIRGIEDKGLVNITYGQPIKVNWKVGFEWLCSAKNGSSEWQPTPIMFHNSTSVSLSAATCPTAFPEIHGVRYHWRESPCLFKKCTIYGTTNMTLPAPPFMALVKSGQRFAEFETPNGPGFIHFS